MDRHDNSRPSGDLVDSFAKNAPSMAMGERLAADKLIMSHLALVAAVGVRFGGRTSQRG